MVFQLSQVGGKSDLVIHEATIEHGMVNRAMHARHSTVKEAIQQTGEMGSKFTILTHFHPGLAVNPGYCFLFVKEMICQSITPHWGYSSVLN